MSDHALAEASGVISSISQVNIQIEVLSQGPLDLHQTLNLFDEAEPLTVAVSQQLRGFINGHGILLLKDQDCMLLIREVLNETARLRELTEMEEEALLEIANIVINSCLSNYAGMLNGRVNSQLPRLKRVHYSQLLQSHAEDIERSGIFCVALRIFTPTQTLNASLLWIGLKWDE